MLKKKLKRNPANGRYTAPRAEASTSRVEGSQVEPEPSTSYADEIVLDCERVKRQAKQLLEIKKRNIQEKIVDLDDQIEQVRKGVHPEYLKHLRHDKSHRTNDDKDISEKEAEKRAHHLKDELISELEGMKRIIQRDVSWLTDDIPGKIANTLEECPTLKKLKDCSEENYNAIQNLLLEDLLDPNVCTTRRSSRKLEEHSISASKKTRSAPARSYNKAARKVDMKDKKSERTNVFSSDEQLSSVSKKTKKTTPVKSGDKTPLISDFKLDKTDESNKFPFTDEVVQSQPKMVSEDAYAKNPISGLKVERIEEPNTNLPIEEPAASRHPRKAIPVKYKASCISSKKIESDDSSNEVIFPALKKMKSEAAKFPNHNGGTTIMSSESTEQTKNIIFPDELLPSVPNKALKTTPQPYDRATYLSSKKIEEPKSFPHVEDFVPPLSKRSIKATPSCSNDINGNFSGKKMETEETRNVSFHDEATPSVSKKTRIPPVRSCGKKAEKVDEVKLLQMRYADAANYIQADLDLIKSQVAPMGYDSEDSDELLKSNKCKTRTSESKQTAATPARSYNKAAGSIDPKAETSEESNVFFSDEQLQFPYKRPKKTAPVKSADRTPRIFDFKLNKTGRFNTFAITEEIVPSQPKVSIKDEHAKNNISGLKVEKTEESNNLLSFKKTTSSRHPRKSKPVKYKSTCASRKKSESDDSSDEEIFPHSKKRLKYEAAKPSSCSDSTTVISNDSTEQTKNIIFPDELLPSVPKKALKTSPQPYYKATYLSSRTIERPEEPKSFPYVEDFMSPLPKKWIKATPACSFDRIGNFTGWKTEAEEARNVYFQGEAAPYVSKKMRIPPARSCGKKAEKVDEVKLSQMRYADAANYIQEDLDLIKSCDASKMKPGDIL